MLSAALLAASLATAATAAAQTPPDCLDIGDMRDAEVTLEGRLTRHVFPGPPNYEDVRHGDAAEPTYILELRAPVCLNGGETPQTDRAHLYTTHDLWARLHAARGKLVRVHGVGFGETTGHHHAPLVVDVDRIVVERASHVHR